MAAVKKKSVSNAVGTADHNPRVLVATNGGQWADVAEHGAGEGQMPRDEFGRILTDILLSQNLIVLCGLGTSLCLSEGGNRLAPTMSDLWEEAKAVAGDGFDTVCKKVKYPQGASDNVELLLSHCQLFLELENDVDVRDFVKATEQRIVARCRFVGDHTDLHHHETFLRKVARRSARKPRMQLFTINYDLCFEKAASNSRFVVIDGFSHTHPQEFDGTNYDLDFVRRDVGRDVPAFLPNVFHLCKIHGSVDWKKSDRQVVRDPSAEHPLIIFPQRGKYESSYQHPFIELMARLQIGLRQENTGLLVVGFGFNDSHITEPILGAIRSNVSLKAAIVDPLAEENTNGAYTEVSSLIRAGDSRLSLIHSTFEQVVTYIPDLVARTEEERHYDRVKGHGGSV